MHLINKRTACLAVCLMQDKGWVNAFAVGIRQHRSLDTARARLGASSRAHSVTPVMSTTPSVASEGRTSVAATKAEELQARAKALREEVKELEASAAGTRRPKEVVEAQQAVPLPRTLLDSCWKVVLEIRGTKTAKNRVPVRLTFCTKFSSDDNILLVEEGHRFVKRGFVWEPERSPEDGRDFITFIAQVEGLSAVPDGKIYLNAFIDTIEDEDGTKRYQFSEGAITIKEVITKSFLGIFNTAGLLAQFKVVGTWEAFPINELPGSKPSTEGVPESMLA